MFPIGYARNALKFPIARRLCVHRAIAPKEEEKTARDIVAKFMLVKDDPAALLDLDRELGSRQPEPAAAAP